MSSLTPEMLLAFSASDLTPLQKLVLIYVAHQRDNGLAQFPMKKLVTFVNTDETLVRGALHALVAKKLITKHSITESLFVGEVA